MADEKMTVEVFRYDPDAASGDGDTRFDSYEVPYQSEWVVLDALNWIKDEVDGSLPPLRPHQTHHRTRTSPAPSRTLSPKTEN